MIAVPYAHHEMPWWGIAKSAFEQAAAEQTQREQDYEHKTHHLVARGMA